MGRAVPDEPKTEVATKGGRREGEREGEQKGEKEGERKGGRGGKMGGRFFRLRTARPLGECTSWGEFRTAWHRLSNRRTIHNN